ncbi:MAG: sulfotransferase [Vicingaceae bacterium]
MNEKPIFILGSHKSGTSLLRNLFDGHSALWTNPIETHFFKYFGSWVDYEYHMHKPETISNEAIKTKFIEVIAKLNERDNPLADSQTKGLFDLDRFNQKIKDINDQSSKKEIIELYFKAIHYSIYGNELKPEQRIVHKAVGLAEFALELHQLFPKAKFVHIVRNPYPNLVSFRKFLTSTGSYPLLNRMISSLRNNYFYLYKNKQLIPNYYIIRYEDLVQNFDEEIKKLSTFLDINVEDALFQPSSVGKAWKGNSTTNQKFQGISSSHLEVWKKKIHPIEAHYVNNNFDHILRDFGYDIFETKKSKFLPAPKESIIRYLYNRLYMVFNRFYDN